MSSEQVLFEVPGVKWCGKSATLVLTTGAAERRVLRSRNEALVVDVASAVNLAIMKRGAQRG